LLRQQALVLKQQPQQKQRCLQEQGLQQVFE